MNQLRRMELVNSAHVRYREVMLDGHIHFIGTQGTGKSTLLRWLATAYLLRLKDDPDFADFPDMASLPDGEFEAEEARGLLSELMEDLHDVNPVLRRMLENEVRVDLDMWDRRLRAWAAR